MLIKLTLMFLVFATLEKNGVLATNVKDDIADLKIAVSNLENKIENFHSGINDKEANLHLEITREEYAKLLADLEHNKNEYQGAKVQRRIMRSDIAKLKAESHAMKVTLQKLLLEISEIKENLENTIKQQGEAIVNISELKTTMESYKTGHPKYVIHENFEIKNSSQVVKPQVSEIESNILQPKNEPQTVVSEETHSLEVKECHQSEENASLCIQIPSCAYCIQNTFRSGRCDFLENLTTKGCPAIEILSNVDHEIILGEITERNIGPSKFPVIPLCPGTKRNISLFFRASKQLIDVYVLSDYWAHRYMKRHHPDSIRKILEALHKITNTNYFTLGFGISIDKPKMPFGISSGFSFHNVLPLTNKWQYHNSIDNFRRMEHYNEISYWGDEADGQLDGIFQAATCKAKIGWRKNSRRILVVAAESGYHVQGDGASGGIQKSFDGLCALNASGFYHYELTQDYPSENQIVQAIKNEDVNVIFALEALPKTFEQYKNLADKLDPPAFAFLSNFANLSDTLIHGHHNIFSVIDESEIPDNIKIKNYSHCNAKTTEEAKTCGHSVNGEITLKLQIELLQCSSNVSGQKRFLKIVPKKTNLFTEIPIYIMCNCNL